MKRDIVVTAANDGKHMANSLHYKNRALDFRIKDMTKEEVEKFVAYMQNGLSSAYDVVLENNPPHLHVEADRV